jgi:hypothetical protein
MKEFDEIFEAAFIVGASIFALTVIFVKLLILIPQ